MAPAGVTAFQRSNRAAKVCMQSRPLWRSDESLAVLRWRTRGGNENRHKLRQWGQGWHLSGMHSFVQSNSGGVVALLLNHRLMASNPPRSFIRAHPAPGLGGQPIRSIRLSAQVDYGSSTTSGAPTARSSAFRDGSHPDYSPSRARRCQPCRPRIRKMRVELACREF